MLASVRLVAPIKLDKEEMQPVLRRLASQKGWDPAVIASERAIAERAGLDATTEIKRIRPFFGGDESAGDVFFREGCVLYALAPVSQGDSTSGDLEVGGFGQDEAKTRDQVRQLATDLQAAISSTLAGRRVRHMQFDWEEPPVEVGRLNQIRETASESEDLQLANASLDEASVNAAHVLAEKPVRMVLHEISQAKIALERDITNRWKRRRGQIDVEGILRKASEAGLLDSELIVECRATSAPVARLRNRNELEGPSGDITCANCGRPFREESVAVGYSLAELGNRLVQGSHWMTIWLTEKLVGLGVPLASIIWNISEDGDEIDLLVEFAGDLWIFELKDRPFGAGDAHPFNYRRVRYRADAAVVVTTEKVDEPAKRVFKELADRDEPGRPRRAAANEPIYIEGLEAVDIDLTQAMNSAAMVQVYRALFPISSAAGIDFGQIAVEAFTE